MNDTSRLSPAMTAPAALGVVLVVAVAWNLIGNLLLPGAWYVPANLAVAVITVVIARRAGLGPVELGLARADLGRGAVVGALAMLVVGTVIAIAVLVPATRDFFADDGVAGTSTLGRWYDGVIRIPLGTAVFEEVLFRSVLLGLAMAMVSTRRAVIATSFVFGFWHVVPALEGSSASVAGIVATTVGTVAVTTVAGLGFAWLRLRSGSVLAPIMAHTATNSFAYLAAVVVIEVFDG